MIQPAQRRFFHWLYNRIGSQTLLRLTPLSLALVCISAGLSAIVTNLPINWLYSTAFLGVLVGWILARSRLPGWGSGLAAAGVGLVWLSLTTGQVGLTVLGLISASFAFFGQFIHLTTPDPGLMLHAWNAFLQSLAALANHLALWFGGASAGKPVTDPVVTGLLWGLALWLAAAWSAWWVRRRNLITVGMIPPMTLLAYNIFYTNSAKGIAWLALAGGAWLALQAAHSYLAARQRWQERRLDQAEIEPQLAIAVGLLVAGFVLAGIFLPSFSIAKISDSLQRLFRAEPDNTLAESLGLQQTPEANGAASGSGSVGQSPLHTIGAGPHLSQEVVLLVGIDGYVPPPPSIVEDYITSPAALVHYYWRAQTYEQYNGHAWTTQTGTIEKFAAGSLLQPELAGSAGNYQLVTQHVERVQPLAGTLFVTGELLRADQPATALWRSPGDLIDAQTEASAYTAESRLPYASMDELRAAGSDYPDAIRSRYLALPQELPQRVRDLSLRLTAGSPTPYDQAVALQDYLRQFPYTLDVPAPPQDRDAADFFLFDLQKGYCDYYATSMVVMARAAGIPARLVVGYTSGAYDYAQNRFVVRQVNAHAWAEIYFPGIGWVEFEPTGGQPRPVRPGETAGQNEQVVIVPKPAAGSGTRPSQFDWAQVRRLLVIAEMALAGLLVLLLLPLENWLLYLRPADRAVTAIYRRLYRQGHELGLEPDIARTPHEFAAALAARLEQLAKTKRRTAAISALLPDLDWLTGLYARLLYGPRLPARAEHHRAIHTWARLRRGLRKMK